ncbi:MAG: hypothetical protein HUJ63_10365 [Enterococcus sp.]|nr:hypothetical protein [Enterococcus sp.]
MKFQPGLVGGHCIDVDPYYLSYKAQELGYQSEIILAGRRLNDSMASYIAQKTVKLLINSGHDLSISKVAILGLSFKENCPDVRNTRVIDIVKELKEYGIESVICDPVSDEKASFKLYGINLAKLEDIKDFDALVLAVSHECFKENIKEIVNDSLKDNNSVLIDVKSIVPNELASKYTYWSL